MFLSLIHRSLLNVPPSSIPQPIHTSKAAAYASTRDLRLVGYYQVNERPDDASLASCGGRAAADAAARAGGNGDGGGPTTPIALVMSGHALGEVAAGRPAPELVALWIKGAKGWAAAPSSSLRVPPTAGDLIRSALAAPGAGPTALVDFDDHLADVRLDWRNEGLV